MICNLHKKWQCKFDIILSIFFSILVFEDCISRASLCLCDFKRFSKKIPIQNKGLKINVVFIKSWKLYRFYFLIIVIDFVSYFVFMILLILAFFTCVVYFLFQNKWLCQMVEILNYQRIRSAYIGITVWYFCNVG